MFCPLKAGLSCSASPRIVKEGHCLGCPNSQLRLTLSFTVNQEMPDVRKSTKESTKIFTINLTINYEKPAVRKSTIFLVDCQHHCQLTQGAGCHWLKLSATMRPA